MMIVINPRSLWKLVGQAARQCQLRVSGTVAERSSSTIARGIEQRRNEGQDLAGQEAHPAKLVSKHLACAAVDPRSEEHTSELQSLMRISYAVFCLKKQRPNCVTRGERPTPQDNDNTDNTRSRRHTQAANSKPMGTPQDE